MLPLGSDLISSFVNTPLTHNTFIAVHLNQLKTMTFHAWCFAQYIITIGHRSPRVPYTAVTLCVSIHTLTTQHIYDSALGGTGEMSSRFPLHSTPALFSFTLASVQGVKLYLSSYTDGDTGKRYRQPWPGGSWYGRDPLCSTESVRPRRGAAVGEHFPDLRVWDTHVWPGWGTVHSSGLGSPPHAHTHTHTHTRLRLTAVSEIHMSAFFTLLFSLHWPCYTPPLPPSLLSFSLYTAFHSRSSAFLHLSLHVLMWLNPL